MASKPDRFYFENFVSAAECCCNAAKYLETCLTHYDHRKIETMLQKMHAYEHEADAIKHQMSSALAKAFVTPIDREDLAEISQNIDEVADCIEEVLQRFYVDRIEVVTQEAIEFSRQIVVCCDLMRNLLIELNNFKRPQKLHEMIVALNHLEENCDHLYLKATHDIKNYTFNVLTILFWREIYDHLEKCADACEHVGDCVETIVMKNT